MRIFVNVDTNKSAGKPALFYIMIANSINLSNQRTLSSEFSFSGVGLHLGKNATVKILPDLPNTGIKFIRSDIKNNNVVKAIWTNVVSTTLSTTIANKNKVSVSTIEHLMSALSGMHIDNAKIYIDGPEVPIMDGSSRPFVELIEKAKIIEQSSKRNIIKVLKSVEVNKDDSYVRLLPNDQFSIDFEIEFESSIVKKQECKLQLINGNYKSDLCAARTFGFEKDVNRLRKNGYALGGSLENAVVVGENNILNKEGLRYRDEFVRHKMLDLIGDIYLLGCPVQGYFYGKKSGHYLNNELIKKLISSSENYTLI